AVGQIEMQKTGPPLPVVNRRRPTTARVASQRVLDAALFARLGRCELQGPAGGSRELSTQLFHPVPPCDRNCRHPEPPACSIRSASRPPIGRGRRTSRVTRRRQHLYGLYGLTRGLSTGRPGWPPLHQN